ncbi:FAD-dependent oxidoreductase [Virgibacillus sp. LDC-1]|uniref:NAD(P)/FAD-dependent oxidoreductase n=1 Tax=Virgibacillus sp. LDC-1 TaxID=3039856 RepID=UPI0024DDFAAD|nr:FAD-dependent oxidoreductase [Virgibacillus sp. LDC-1]
MYDVVIIGAGPAGLSAAIACREWDLHVLVIDEFPKPGGRLLGQLHQEPNGEWWNGIHETELLLHKAKELNTVIQCGVSAHHIEKLADGFSIRTNEGSFSARKLLIATGAAETAAPIPGWTLPGVMSIGAAQVMTNVHRVRVGKKGIIVGVNVLSAAIARELQLAGIELHSMALPAKNTINAEHGHPKKVMEGLVRIAHLAPSFFIRFGSKFAKSSWIRNLAVTFYPKSGVKMWGMPIHIRKAVLQINGTTFYPKSGVKMWGMPIHIRKAVLQINGTDKVESVTICNITAEGEPISGTEQEIKVDFVCIAGGLYPLTELAAVINCPFQYVEELGGHVPIHNEQMETAISGLYVAGNITGIESAKVARAQGHLAGLSIVHASIQVDKIKYKIDEAIAEVKAVREAASIQFHPSIQAGREKIEQAFNKQKQAT